MTTTFGTSKLQGNFRINRMAKGVGQRTLERRRRHCENSRPIDHLEAVWGDQRFQLLHREWRVTGKKAVRHEQETKKRVGNRQNAFARAPGRSEFADQIDEIDRLKAGNVVNAAARPIGYAGHDDVTKISGVRRLPQVFAIRGNRKHWRTLHEPRQPAKMLAVEPAEHEGWPQGDRRQAGIEG